MMPIRAENRSRYPKNWKAISRAIRERAGGMCEWERCQAVNGLPHPRTGSKVVLTVAHLDHTPENCDPSNLMAMCQRCHNRYDASTRQAGIRSRRFAMMAAGDLFE
jgi:5-methylcytosine-specific restriction endonuclease McrA